MKRFLLGLSILVAAVSASVLAATALAKTPEMVFASPSPAEAATLTTDSVQFAFTFNRAPKAAETLTCDLAGPTASAGPCDTPVLVGDKASSSGASYTGLANGAYTFTVTLGLTDSGMITAVRHFTVDVPPLCTAGSEDFSSYYGWYGSGDQPTTFGGAAGGTIDTAYTTDGGVFPAGFGFPSYFGAQSLYTGYPGSSFQLTFYNAVGFVQLDAMSNNFSPTPANVTLTGYDAADNVVATDSLVQSNAYKVTLSISSASDDIKYFTIATDAQPSGLFIANISWSCG